MDSVIIQSNFPHRISLSQASQITGYHQDYLGLLCRLGKIRASKIGRNWYTTQSEISKFISPTEQVGEYMPEAEDIEISEIATPEPEARFEEIKQAVKDSVVSMDAAMAAPIKRAAAPAIVENYVITELSNLPIKLVKKPASPQHHTLQSLITRTKLEQLKQEVLELSGFMNSVSNELAEHKAILERHESMLAMRKDLASAYASNIDFGMNPSEHQKQKTTVTMIEDPQDSAQDLKVVWLWPSLAIGVIIFVSLLALFKNLPENLNYASTNHFKSEQSIVTPQVAGDSDVAPLNPTQDIE